MKKLYNNKIRDEENLIGLDLSKIAAFWLVNEISKCYVSATFPIDYILGKNLVILIHESGNEPFKQTFTYSRKPFATEAFFNYKADAKKLEIENFYVGKEIYDDLVKYWSEKK